MLLAARPLQDLVSPGYTAQAFAILYKLRSQPGGERRERKTREDFGVLAVLEPEERDAPVLVAADLGHAKGGVNREASQRKARYIDLDDQIRRRGTLGRN